MLTFHGSPPLPIGGVRSLKVILASGMYFSTTSARSRALLGEAAHVVYWVGGRGGFDEALGELAQIVGADERRQALAVHVHLERLAYGRERWHVRPVLRR